MFHITIAHDGRVPHFDDPQTVSSLCKRFYSAHSVNLCTACVIIPISVWIKMLSRQRMCPVGPTWSVWMHHNTYTQSINKGCRLSAHHQQITAGCTLCTHHPAVTCLVREGWHSNVDDEGGLVLDVSPTTVEGACAHHDAVGLTVPQLLQCVHYTLAILWSKMKGQLGVVLQDGEGCFR